MKLPIPALILSLAIASVVLAADKNPRFTAAQGVEFVNKPGEGFGNMSPFELQVDYRLNGLIGQTDYEYREEDAATWKACMQDGKRNMYARLCAAYFLLDGHEDARDFIREHVRSKNVRHRYNAAQILNGYMDETPAKSWAVKLLIGILADGSLDGSGIHESPPGEYPNGDRDDIMCSPIDGICGHLGSIKAKEAVPGIISVLERIPNTYGAAMALGEIGDTRAIPILIKVLRDGTGNQESEVVALGRLKAVEAVPIMASLLGHPKNTGGLESERVLEALLDIGDKRAIPAIEEYLKGDFPKQTKAIARRVLAQLNSEEPVKTLLELLHAETYEPERSNLIGALTKHKDSRVVEELANLARTSDSAFMRREAIYGLAAIGDQASLLVLAALLDHKFPKDLTAEWGWKGVPDFPMYFPKTITECLERCTKQDFGKDRAKWEEWINKNVQSGIRE